MFKFQTNTQLFTTSMAVLYRGMLTSFFKANTGLPEVTIDETIPFPDIFQQLHSIISDKKTFHQFLEYVHKQAELDDMWKFWYSFVFMEGLVYIQLYIAIRCQNWEMRVSALKLMAPTFLAYDRTTYQKLIPHRLAELQKFPPSIMNKLKQGFTVSINGERGRAVAFDEAHEMCINKDMKMAIVRPTQSYLQKTSLFLRYRISAHKNLLAQLFPQYDSKPVRAGIVDRTPEIKAKEENIIAMTETINKTNLFITPVQENRGLSNMFTSIKATPEQRHDLLKFRQIGEDGLTNYINYYLLKNPSTKTSMHSNKLTTMAPRKTAGKRQMNQKEKEMKQVTKCLRQRLAWCNRTKQSYDPNQEQYSLLPPCHL